MASKVLAQVLVYTTQVFTRAFVDAYRQAAANAAKGGAAAHAARAATGAAREAAKDIKSSTVINGISIAEARQILNIRESDSLEKVLQHYEHLFKMNEKANGGSFYLQSKVVRAREALEYELKARQTQQAASGASS